MGIFGKPLLIRGIGSASGSVASFGDGAPYPVRELNVSVEPVQDLHGYDAPWPAGGGINAMPPAVAKSETQNGVTVSTDGSGVYSISAVAEADTVIEFPLINSFVIPDGTPVDGTHSLMLKNTFASNGVTIYFYNGTMNLDSWIASPSNRVAVNYSSLANKTCDCIKVKVTSGTSVTGTFGIMFVPKGTASNTPFAPYSNICPISGWNEVNVWRTGKNLLDDSTRTTYSSGLGLRWYKADGFVLKANQTYTFSFSGSEQTIMLYIMDKATETALANSNSGSVMYTPTADTVVYFQAYRNTAIEDSNVFMLELGSTATSYTPYTGTTIPISWQSTAGTIYGGELDVVNGKLRVTHKLKTPTGTGDYSTGNVVRKSSIVQYNSYYFAVDNTMRNSNKSLQGAVSNIFKNGGAREVGSATDYMFFTNFELYTQLRFNLPSDSELNTADKVNNWIASLYSAGNPLQFVLPLATPVEYDLTPEEVTTLLGSNTLWADCGPVEVEYQKRALLYMS